MAHPNVLYVWLVDTTNPSLFVTDPTIVTGDFQVSIDGGAKANLTTLPTVEPSGSDAVKITLSDAELNGTVINIFGEDQSADQWDSARISLNTEADTDHTILDIIEGDHVETSTSLTINLKGTTTPVLQKTIGGSLLPSNVTITTTES